MLVTDEFDPGQQALLSAMRDRSVPLSQLSITARISESTLRKCRDGNKELEEMARWTRYWFEAEPNLGSHEELAESLKNRCLSAVRNSLQQ